MHACRETEEQRAQRLEEEAAEAARAAEAADLKVPRTPNKSTVFHYSTPEKIPKKSNTVGNIPNFSDVLSLSASLKITKIMCGAGAVGVRGAAAAA